MAIPSSPLLTIPGMMGPRTTTNRASAIVAPQQQTQPMYPGRPLNTAQPMPAAPQQASQYNPNAVGPMGVHAQVPPIMDYAPPQAVDDVANSQAALGRGNVGPGAPVYRSPQEQATINSLTYGDGSVHAPGLGLQTQATAGNSGIVPPGHSGIVTPPPRQPGGGIETMPGSPAASGATLPGVPRAPTMPVGQAMRQQPTTSQGLPAQPSNRIGRPAGGMFPRLG